MLKATSGVTPELAREIRERIAGNEGFDAYWVPFKSYNLGREMKGTFWQFDKVRLYRRDKASWQTAGACQFCRPGKRRQADASGAPLPISRLENALLQFDRMTRLEALR